MPQLVTTLGSLEADQLGLILPHEHIFVDLRTWHEPGYDEADPQDVVRLMTPYVQAAQAAGVTAIVEPSTGGVGRRADILLAVSQATSFPLAAPTGVYREPWIPLGCIGLPRTSYVTGCSKSSTGRSSRAACKRGGSR